MKGSKKAHPPAEVSKTLAADVEILQFLFFPSKIVCVFMIFVIFLIFVVRKSIFYFHVFHAVFTVMSGFFTAFSRIFTRTFRAWFSWFSCFVISVNLLFSWAMCWMIYKFSWITKTILFFTNSFLSKPQSGRPQECLPSWNSWIGAWIKPHIYRKESSQHLPATPQIEFIEQAVLGLGGEWTIQTLVRAHNCDWILWFWLAAKMVYIINVYSHNAPKKHRYIYQWCWSK